MKISKIENGNRIPIKSAGISFHKNPIESHWFMKTTPEIVRYAARNGRVQDFSINFESGKFLVVMDEMVGQVTSIPDSIDELSELMQKSYYEKKSPENNPNELFKIDIGALLETPMVWDYVQDVNERGVKYMGAWYHIADIAYPKFGGKEGAVRMLKNVIETGDPSGNVHEERYTNDPQRGDGMIDRIKNLFVPKDK